MKYECEKIKDLIPMLICEELDADEARKVKAHIEECPECRREYDMMLGMENALSEAEYEAPSELHSAIMSAVNRERRKDKKIKTFVKRMSVIAATAAVVALIINVIPGVIRENGNKTEEFIVNEKRYLFVDAEAPNGSSESYVPLSNETIGAFCGEWAIPLTNGNNAVLKINEDMSAEVCIVDKYGIEIYYDGTITLDASGNARMTQSDGEVSYSALIEMFIKDGSLCINVKRGQLPFTENHGGV